MALKELEERGYPQDVIDAVAGHADFLEVPRETQMAKTLYAVDELSGFIAACALVRPTGIEGMKTKSVRKKLKQPSFAAAVDRDGIRRGIEELGVDEGEHIQFVIDAMAENAERAGAHRRTGRGRWLVKRAVWIVIALLVVIAVALTLNTITVNNETKGAEVTAEGGEILELSSGDVQVVETPAQTDRPGAADRPDPRVHRIAALVGLDDPAALGGPPRDRRGPPRPRRLREARRRLRHGGPGVHRRGGAQPASGPGSGGRRALDGRVGRHRAGDAVERARGPGRHPRLGPQQHRLRAGPPIPRQAGLRAGDRPAPEPHHARRGRRGRLRGRLRPRLRHRERLREPRPGRGRLQGDDLHVVQGEPRRRGLLHRGGGRSTSASPTRPCP